VGFRFATLVNNANYEYMNCRMDKTREDGSRGTADNNEGRVAREQQDERGVTRGQRDDRGIT
jgi:hypothetical protein